MIISELPHGFNLYFECKHNILLNIFRNRMKICIIQCKLTNQGTIFLKLFECEIPVDIT